MPPLLLAAFELKRPQGTSRVTLNLGLSPPCPDTGTPSLHAIPALHLRSVATERGSLSGLWTSCGRPGHAGTPHPCTTQNSISHRPLSCYRNKVGVSLCFWNVRSKQNLSSGSGWKFCELGDFAVPSKLLRWPQSPSAVTLHYFHYMLPCTRCSPATPGR